MTTTQTTNATTVDAMSLVIDEAFSTNYWWLDTRTDPSDSCTTMTWRECNVNYTARIVIQEGNTHVDIFKGSDGPRVFHIELDMTINDPELNKTIVTAIAARFDS